MLGSSSNYFDHLLAELLKAISPNNVLELGCGSGKIGNLFVQQGLSSHITAIQKLFKSADRDNLMSKGYQRIIDADIKEYFFNGFDDSYDLIIAADVIEHFMRCDAFSIIDFALYRAQWLILIWPSKHPQAGLGHNFDRHRCSFELLDLASQFDIVFYRQAGFAPLPYLHRYHICVLRGHMHPSHLPL